MAEVVRDVVREAKLMVRPSLGLAVQDFSSLGGGIGGIELLSENDRREEGKS